MRAIGTMHPTDQVPMPPDTVNTILLTGGSSAQGMDYPSGAQVMRLTPVTTAGGAFFCMLNMFSTAAAVPAAGSSASSTGVNHPVMSASVFQIPAASTGFSVAAYSSGLAIAEFWKK